MSIVSGIAIYFIIWWVTLFTILPIGVRSQEEASDVTLGTEHGAPVRAQLPLKIGVTTLVASAIFGLFYYLVTYSGVGLDDIPFLPDFSHS